MGTELSLAYSGRLLIVMPNGYGVWWQADQAGGAELQTALAGRSPSAETASALVAATVSAVDRVESAAGVSAARLAHGPPSAPAVTSSPDSGPATVTFPHKAAAPAHHSSSVGVVVAIALILLLTGYIAVRSGRLNGLRLGSARAR